MPDDRPTHPERSENAAAETPNKLEAAEASPQQKLTAEEKDEIFRELRELQDMGVLDNQPD